MLISLVVLIILFYLNRKQVTEKEKLSFVLVSDLFLFLAGFYCCYVYDVKNDPSYFGAYVNSEQQMWVGEVKDLSVEKEKFYKVLMSVKGFQGKTQLNGNALVYIKKPIDVTQLKPGMVLQLESNFIQPPAPLNPHEFNYKEFLERKNIHFQSFVDPENVQVLGESNDFSVINFGLEIKHEIKACFENSTLNKEAAQLCVALLTGYDDEIDTETINAFAHSGTLHVLSVSGLHTGILYAVLVFVLGWIDRNRKYKFLQLAIISLSLWFFALITGFAPPVLRAVIMLNLIAIGRAYYSYSSQHSVNILSVSAFLILVFDPLLVYDTGFLLSYSAVAGILYFEPGFTALVDSRYWIVNKVWQLTSVSLAAQIATLPITLYLFHQFPLWFIFSNLIVIPLCTVVMFLGFLILLKLNFVAPLINGCSSFIFYCIHLTDGRDSGYIDQIDFTWSDLIFLTAFIIAVAIFVKHRTYVYVAGAAVLLILWQMISLFEVAEKKSETHLGIYHINKQTAVDVKNKGIINFNSELNSSNYNYHVKPNQTTYNYADMYSLGFDYVRSSNVSFLKLSSPEQKPLIGFLRPDYLLVSNNTQLEEAYLTKNVRMVIADGSNNYKNIKELKALCDKFAVPFHATREKGYLQLNL